MKKIVLGCILLCTVLVGCGRNTDTLKGFEYFYADNVDIVIQEDTEITFTASIFTEEKVDKISVQTESGQLLGYLYDDGTGKDENAGDNIFVGNISMRSDEEKHENIFAVANNVRSQNIEIFFYEELTEDDYKQLTTVNAEINEMQQKYIDNEGFVREENKALLLSEVSHYLEEKKQLGIVVDYEKGNNCVYTEFSNGVGYMFIPNQKDTLSAGAAKRITTVEPVRDSFGITTSLGFTWLDKKYGKLEYQGGYDVPSNAQMVVESNNSYYYNIGVDMDLSSTEYMKAEDDHYVNEEVSIDNIKELAGSGIIIWEGHGGYSEKIGSALITSESASMWQNLQKYSADLKEKRLITTGGWYTLGSDFLFCNYAVTSKFFDHYFEDNSFDECLVYLGACNSGTDDRLANSFLNKGAKGVYCSNGTIFMEYEMLMRTTIFYNLLKQTESGDFFTVKQALEAAWDTIGLYDPKNQETFITYYGDEEYRLIVNEVEEQIKSGDSDNGWIDQDKTKLELGENLNVFLSNIYGYGVREYDFNDYDMYSLMMNVGYRLPEGTYEEREGSYYWVVDYNILNDILYKYFRISAPQEKIGDILYQEEKYFFPELDYGELGMPLLIANHVEQINGKYEVTFDVAYVWSENFDTGKENPIQDWNLYYSYDINQIDSDEFCEIIGYGNAVIELEEKNMSILEFHSHEGYATPLTKEQAYEEVEKYWTSLGNNMPENIECEGLTEYGYCFWGYNMTGSHANTLFRIAVDINTGQLYDFIEDRYI